MTDEDKGASTEGLGTYDLFLKAAIRTYWENGADRRNFISLLLASREAWEVAFEGARDRETGKKLLAGTAGAAAVMLLVRAVLGGPVGIVLTAASIASLGALYARNHARIWAQQARYRDLLSLYRVKHKSVRAKYVDGVIDESERDLMLDGLLRRLLQELDDEPELEENPDGSEEEPEN